MPEDDPFFTVEQYDKLFKAGAISAATAVAKLGVSAKQAGDAMSALGKAITQPAPTITAAMERGTTIHNNIQRQQAIGSLGVQDYAKGIVELVNDRLSHSEEALVRALDRFKTVAPTKAVATEATLKPGPARVKRTIST